MNYLHKSKTGIRIKRIIALVILIGLSFSIVRFVLVKPKVVLADSLFKLDEGYGTNISDANQNVSAGTITGAVWKTNDLCFDGKCLFFDGDQDYVSFADDADLDFAAANSFTVNAWFRHTTMTTGTHILVGKILNSDNDGGYQIQMESDGDITCEIEDDDADTTIDDSATSTTATYDDNLWHFVSCVKSGTTSLTLYIDGAQIAQDASLDASSTLANDDTFYIGMDGDGTSNDYTGFIDEVKVYRSARTAAEIKADMLGETPNRGTAASFGPTQDWLSNGLVGYWKMDETSGNPVDSSGNGLTLTNNGTATFVGGKFGNGSEHVPASSQHFSTATTISGVKSVSFWANPDATTNYMVSLTSGAYITASSGTISATGFTSPTIYVNGVASTTLTQDVWQLVTVTTETAIDANQFYVGRQGSNYYDGTMDEVRTYNRALSPAEVSKLYNFAPGPVGYWKMDENTGMSANDSSSNGLIGTLGSLASRQSFTIYSSSANFGTGAYTTTSFTPSNNSLLVVTAAAMEQGGSDDITTCLTITDSQTLTWTSRVSATNTSSWAIGMRTWTAPVTTGSSMTITVDCGAFNIHGYKVGVANYTGYDTQSPIGATGVDNNGPVNGAHTVTLSVAPAKMSQVIATMYADTDTAQSVTPGTEWTEIGDDNTIQNLMHTQVRSSSTSTSISYNDVQDQAGTPNKTIFDAVEIKADPESANWDAGKFGSSTQFDGVGNFIDIGTGPIAVNTVAFWAKPTTTTEYFIDLNGSAYISSSGGTVSATGFTSPTIYVNGVPSSTITAGVWQHIAITTSTSLNASDLDIGRIEGVGHMEGQIDDVKFYNYARISSQVIEDMNAGHPAPGSPVGSSVAYWKFDEGYGTSANDSSINSNTLTLSSASWTNSGKFGKAFNGLDNVRLSRTTDADLEFGAAEDFTLSLWYKSDSDSNPGATEYLMNDGAAAGSAGYAIYANTSGNICFGIDDDASWGPDVASCTSTDVYDNTWHHVTAVRNVATDTTKIYIDAVEKDSDTDSTSATLDSSPTFYIGDANGTDGTDEFLGDIDEVKIFRSALTADAIKVLYNQNAGQQLGAVSTDSSNNPSNSSADSYCPPGQGSTCTPPVGRWKLDENTGTTANDISGNANAGTLTLGPTWVPGKLGSAVNFDGSNDYIDVGSPATFDPTSGTVSLWIYPPASSTNDMVFFAKDNAGSNTGDFFLMLEESDDATNPNKITYQITDGNDEIQSDSAITFGQWTHISATFGTGGMKLYINGILQQETDAATTGMENASANLIMGSRRSDTGFYSGRVDDTRIYNYARTPAQIAWDYNRGGPIAWWDLNEGTGSNANDSTGNSLTGTVTIGGSGSQTTTTQAWNNGAVGKLNGSLNFDGTDDYIVKTDDNALDITGSFSISSWIYLNSIPSSGNGYFVLEKHTSGTSGNYYFYFWDPATQGLSCAFSGGPDHDYVWNPSTSQWYHLTCVFDNDGNTLKIYIDGKQVLSESETNTPAAGAGSLNIGRSSIWTDYEFDGRLDDVRIYNYPLSPQQIKTVMGEGAVRFGPLQGSP